jgi:hypothetical protein
LRCRGCGGSWPAACRPPLTRLIHYTARHGITTIAVEDLDFADARTVGRETMGRGRRCSATALPRRPAGTASACSRSTPPTPARGETSTPYENVTRHQAAATVIGRRAQGFSARRREGVTRTRPEDRAVRAIDQAAPDKPTGEYQEPPPARDTGNQIPPAPPGTNAITGPGNRYPGTGQQRPTPSVTVRSPAAPRPRQGGRGGRAVHRRPPVRPPV